MRPSEDPSSLEQILQQSGRLKSLARSMVGDAAQAEDIVQDTMLAVLERGSGKEPATGAWLAGVVRNKALRFFRDIYRRRRRERLIARPERIRTTPQDLVERAELQRKIVGAVLQLAEPYRSTVLLRFFEEASPREIAGIQGVPEATVWTRIHRALAHLRSRLDREYGGERRAWLAILLPTLGAGTLAAEAAAGAAEGAAGASCAASASTAAASAATGGAGTTAGITCFTIGGIVMTQKIIVGFSLLGLTALALGVGLGRFTAPAGPSPETIAAKYVDRSEHEAVKKQNEDLRAQIAKVAAEKSRADSENEELKGRVGALEKQMEEEKAAQVARKPEGEAKGLPVAFGKFAELEEIQKADWLEMAEAVEKINELLLDVSTKMKEGKPIDVDLQQKVGEQNQKLVRYYAKIMGKIPTNGPLNGEFSHPITTANIMAAMLDRAQVPLTDEQVQAIARLGGEYEKDYEDQQEKYGESTPRLLKMMDELMLKKKCYDAMGGLLTQDQRDAVIHPDIHNRLQLDTLSPATMAILLATPSYFSEREALPGKIAQYLGKDLGIPVDDNEAVKAIVDQWAKDLEPLMESPVEDKQPVHLDQALTAGNAQAKALAALLQLPELDEKVKNTLLSAPGWQVPLLLKKGE